MTTPNPLHEVCPTCGRPYEYECVDCLKKFSLSADSCAWFMEKFGNLPARCASCRALRREYKRSHPQGVQK